MNRIYRLVWSHRQQKFVVVHEKAAARGRAGGAVARGVTGVLLAGLLGAALATPAAHTLPTGGQVTAGSATISTSGNTLTVQQASQRAAVNWRTFSVGSEAAVNFVQPSASAVILNRVVGNEQSVIAGALNANGQVFILNANGVLFTQGARVNVGGLVASTLNLSDADFMAGRHSFSANGSRASVVNLGTINAADGGYVALLGNQVKNEGVITARLGSAVLAAGERMSLNFNGNSLVGVTVDQGTLDSLVENKQAIRADGGLVILTAKGLDTVLSGIVNNTGEIRARTVENREGKILLLGDMQSGTVHVGGTLDASAPSGGNGGFIETSAAHVKIDDGVHVTTAAAQGLSGSWLIDPVDFTIAASGGDMTGATLSSSLANGDVLIQTQSATGGNGDIFVNDNVSWSANRLTLRAHRNIEFNTSISASGTGNLALEYGQGALASGNTATYKFNNGAKINLPAGQNFRTKLGSDGTTDVYTVITSLGAAGSTTGTDLQGMNGNLAGKYVLGADIDASATAGWNAGAGFATIGQSPSFTGVFDGLGHVVSGLTINRPNQDNVGLFSTVNGQVRNVGLVNAQVSGRSSVGILVGRIHNGSISNSYTGGVVQGLDFVGGLAGWGTGSNGSITKSHSSANVTATAGRAGGLMGAIDNGSISDSYATGNVTSTGESAGGLVGNAYQASLLRVYATGNVTVNVTANSWNSRAGGLAGNMHAGTISDSYATGAVSGAGYAGGLVGNINAGGQVSNSYATGAVSGAGYAGGLVGHINAGGQVSNSYATGAVSGSGYTGGLVGGSQGTISNSYATGAVTNTDYGSQGVGGLVGYNYGSISNSYATGAVTGAGYAQFAGGLAGRSDGTISNSYATGAVSGADYVGGLVGLNSSAGQVSNSYAIGAVSAGVYGVGGLLGTNGGAVANSYWDTQTSGTSNGVGLNWGTGSPTGLTTAQMGNASNFAGFNFTTTPGATGNNWVIVDVDGTLNNAGGAAGATRPMLASEYSTTIANAHQLQLMAMNKAASYTLARNIDASSTATTGDVWISSTFVPVGAGSSSAFTGSFDGQWHSIRGLRINLPSRDNVGLFGYTGSAAVVQNVGLVGGSVSGRDAVGGLVGYNLGTISNSYVTSAVTGNDTVGGLVGYNEGSINTSYATGAVTGGNIVGGLVGYNQNPGSINTSYATGAVSGSNYAGGLVGLNYGTTSNSYWNTTTSGAGGTSGATGLTTSAMQTQSSFAGWDFANTWFLYEGHTNPLLRAFMTPLTVKANNVVKTYDAQLYAGGGGATYSITNPTVLGALTYGGNAISATNAGSYNITLGGLYSDQQGHIITYANGTLTINKAHLTVTADNASKTYGDANPTLTTTVSGFVNGQTLATSGVTGTGSATTTATAATGAGTATIVAGVGTLAATNYDFTNLVNGTLTINKAPLTITGNSSTVTYDGASHSVSGFTVTGLRGSDTVAGLTGIGASGATRTNAGSSSNTVMAGTQANYTVTLVNGTLTINKAPLTVTANNASKTYGDANPALTTIVSGFVNGQTLATSGVTGIGAATTTATAATGAGTATIVAGVGTLSAANYDFTNLVDGTLTISKAPLTATGNSSTVTYNGTSQNVSGFTVAGLRGSDTLASLTSIVASGASGTNAGSYTNTVTAGTETNYVVTTANGTLAINKAHLTVTANNASKIVGDANPTLTTTVSGFVNGQTLATSGVTGAGSATTAATAVTGAGTATIVAGVGTLAAANYDFTHLVNGTLTILPRPAATDNALLGRTVAAATNASNAMPSSTGSVTGRNVTVAPKPGSANNPSSGASSLVQNQTPSASGMGSGPRLVMTSSAQPGEKIELVSLTEFRGASPSAATGNAGAPATGDQIRIPAGQNSTVMLMDGGVRLPAGIEQQVFVVKAAD